MFRNMKRVLYYVSKPIRELVLCNDNKVKVGTCILLQSFESINPFKTTVREKMVLIFLLMFYSLS